MILVISWSERPPSHHLDCSERHRQMGRECVARVETLEARVQDCLCRYRSQQFLAYSTRFSFSEAKFPNSRSGQNRATQRAQAYSDVWAEVGTSQTRWYRRWWVAVFVAVAKKGSPRAGVLGLSRQNRGAVSVCRWRARWILISGRPTSPPLPSRRSFGTVVSETWRGGGIPWQTPPLSVKWRACTRWR